MFPKLGTVETPRGGGPVVGARTTKRVAQRSRRRTRGRAILALAALAALPALGRHSTSDLGGVPSQSQVARADTIDDIMDAIDELLRLLGGGGSSSGGDAQPPAPPPSGDGSGGG